MAQDKTQKSTTSTPKQNEKQGTKKPTPKRQNEDKQGSGR